MVAISFYAVDREARYGEYHYYSSTPDVCFDVLSDLVREGWRLFSVHYGHTENDKLIWVELPVEAFDGQSMEKSLMSVQKEWEQILC